MSFVHLHVHSEYSLLDGACKIKLLVQQAAALGQQAVAITDHGVMYGVIDFYKAAKAAGVKPILGCEVYVAPRTRFDKVHSLDGEPRHLVLLCKNEQGYRNLCQMVSLAFTEGFYTKPRVDMELLRKYSEGLIALSACLAGAVPRLISAGDYDGAKAAALELLEIFGDDNFYLELQDHGIEEQEKVNLGVLRLHRETGIPLVVTNDVHYITKADAHMQDVLMCIQTNKSVDDTDRMKFETEEFYLKSSDEMKAIFPNYPEAAANTVEIASRCNVEIEFGKYHLPEFSLPDGYTGPVYLKTLCDEGFERRYPGAPDAYRERLAMELEMIARMGFVDYFLIVSDFISFAKSRRISVGPGRGSAAGSMVSYCLGITDIDPMKYNLYFERFLNPERISMPDIDIDFCYIRRQEVIDYVIGKYGADHVAQIVTFGTMAARGAIRDAARALAFSYAEADVIAKQVPSTLNITLDDALKASPMLHDMYEGDERVKKLVDTARAIEGMPRHASTHAAGVVITKEPVSHYVPLSKNDEAIVTQFTMGTLEELGLLKMDFLGLRNLTVIDDAVDSIRLIEPDFDISSIPTDDSAAYEMLCAGKTLGVFQLESAGITAVCTSLRPQSIEDITAIVALYRPGPMDAIPRFIQCKLNPEKIRYLHPMLESILNVTYGCIVYQEQVIEIFRRLGGYSLGQADMMRRAISKKKQESIKKERINFVHGNPDAGIPGAVKNGVPEDVAEQIYDEILDFANYAFNKAHAVAYAVIAYRTAYLKRHYPQQYLAALLTSVLDSSSKIAEYISECRDWNISVLPPDINESRDSFTVSGKDIRFGLVAVKNIGRNFILQMVEERERDGKFSSIYDFCERMFGGDLNRRAVESLIKCGAMDNLSNGHGPLRRSQMLQLYDSILDSIASTRRRNIEGQLDLFGGDLGGESIGYGQPPDIPELSAAELMRMEKETTGLYLSGHPLDEYREAIKRAKVVSIGSLLEDFSLEGGPQSFKDEQLVTVAGVVSAVKTKTTKNNSLMAYVTIEDDTASMELLAFSRVLSEGGNYLASGTAILATGKISARDEKEPQILLNSVRPLSDLDGIKDEKAPQTLWLRLPGEDYPALRKIRAIINMFPGTNKLVIYFESSGVRERGICGIADALIIELTELLGSENVVVK